MNLWVITDPMASRIYGTVEADTVNDAVAAVDGRQADWFWQALPGPNEQLSLHSAFTLADGRWRETMPDRPLPGGDCGGDIQIGDSLGRRWWMALADGNWALYQVTWYLADDTDLGTEPRDACLYLERQEEFLICSDLRNPGGTELWSNYRHQAEPGWAPEPASVELAARDFDTVEIVWDGGEFQ
jgi:hypothetical protein